MGCPQPITVHSFHSSRRSRFAASTRSPSSLPQAVTLSSTYKAYHVTDLNVAGIKPRTAPNDSKTAHERQDAALFAEICKARGEEPRKPDKDERTALVVSAEIAKITADQRNIKGVRTSSRTFPRKTPPAVLEIMKMLATELEAAGWRLHSGGADGADAAFHQGTTPQSRTIYLPWRGYNNHRGADTVVLTSEQQTRAQAVVAGLHSAWQRCGRGARALHGRNHAIVHGVGTGGRTETVSAVICWTPGGRVQGGTATAIKLARAAGLPVLNLAVATVEEVQQTMAELRTRAGARAKQTAYRETHGDH